MSVRKDQRLPADPARAVRDTEHIGVRVGQVDYKLTFDRIYHRLPDGGKGARWVQRVTPAFIDMMVDDDPDNLEIKVMLRDLMDEERREDAQARAFVEMYRQSPPSDRYQ